MIGSTTTAPVPYMIEAGHDNVRVGFAAKEAVASPPNSANKEMKPPKHNPRTPYNSPAIRAHENGRTCLTIMSLFSWTVIGGRRPSLRADARQCALALALLRRQETLAHSVIGVTAPGHDTAIAAVSELRQLQALK